MESLIGTVERKSFKLPLIEIMLLMVAICWGTSYGLTKYSLAYTHVFIFISIRFGLSFLCLLPAIIQDFRLGLNRDWYFAIPTGLILSTIFFFEVFGVLYTTASKAAFLISLSVILTAFAELIINKKRITNFLLGLTVMSVVGVFLLTNSQDFELTLDKGDYFILVAALLRALMVTFTKRLVKDKEISTTTLTAFQSLTVACTALIGALCFLPMVELVIPTNIGFWLTMLYLVLFCTLFAFYIQNYAVRKTSPTRVSLLMGSEPLFGALFAVVWLSESLMPLQIIGGGLILLSVLIASTKCN